MVFIVPVNAMKDLGDFEVYIHSFLTADLCGERVTGQLLALTFLLYDIKLPATTEDEVGWATEPVRSLGRKNAESPVASGDGNRSNDMSEA